MTILGLAPACDSHDEFPTSPAILAPVRSHATIVTANLTRLPFAGRAINESGQVVGTGPGPRGFLWSPADGAVDLGTLGGTIAFAWAINDAGQVVGASRTEGDAAQHAFLWTPGQGMQDLGLVGMTMAYGINNSGQVVGEGPAPDGKTHAKLWTPGQGTQDLGTLGGTLTASAAYAINNAGDVVGESYQPNDPSGQHRATLWRSGKRIEDLGTLGGFNAVARDINDNGQVVGESDTSWGPHRAFLWTLAHGMMDLGSVGGFNSTAFAINAAGQVVGATDSKDGPSHAGVWTAEGGMEDLGVLSMSVAFDINSHLQVVGNQWLVTIDLGTSNRAPATNAGGPYTSSEGSAVTFAFSATDADDDALTYTWDLGDGTTGSGPTPPASHVYADNGTYTVTLTASDGKGGVDTKTTAATIANVAPTIVSGGLTAPTAAIAMASGSASAPISVAFSDPAGTRDTYSAQIQCGNGTTLSPSAINSPSTGTCTYTSAGIYTIGSTVADEDGGVSAPAFYRYVIVYDPEGGSTTGSGFYAIAGQATGKASKAHFTFSAGFLPGQMAPNGTAKFWIPGGAVDFESTAIEMLVVVGNRAQFWGTGTLNGTAARFRITAVDGQAHGAEKAVDAFRMELWHAGVLVFDTQPGDAQDAPVITKIDAGSIQIHRSRD